MVLPDLPFLSIFLSAVVAIQQGWLLCLIHTGQGRSIDTNDANIFSKIINNDSSGQELLDEFDVSDGMS